ncbi:YrzI family small protein [Oceanobacillus sp. 143]|nr:YrzI family small protein [Oceanobacillus sp. 143]
MTINIIFFTITITKRVISPEEAIHNEMLKKSMKNTEKEQLIICVPINFITLKT